MLDRERLRQAFQLLGEHLAGRGHFIELAVYGASAILLQFDWRRTTEDVDAVVREGYDEAVLGPSLRHVAEHMQLSPDWLNNAVGMFTPLSEPDSLFHLSGNFPTDQPGLRVLVATPGYLLAMKLRALSNLDRGEKDMSDARQLASGLQIITVDDLRRLYVSIHGEEPREEMLRRFPAVLSDQ